MVHTIPDVACADSYIAQTTEDLFDITKVLFIELRHERPEEHKGGRSQISETRRGNASLVAYIEASFSNIKNNRSQLGYVICLAGGSTKCAILHYASFRSSRVIRSSMAGGTFAFIERYDNEVLIRHDLQNMLCRKIPLIELTDSKQLLEVLTRARYKTEKREVVAFSAT